MHRHCNLTLGFIAIFILLNLWAIGLDWYFDHQNDRPQLMLASVAKGV